MVMVAEGTEGVGVKSWDADKVLIPPKVFFLSLGCLCCLTLIGLKLEVLGPIHFGWR